MTNGCGSAVAKQGVWPLVFVLMGVDLALSAHEQPARTVAAGDPATNQSRGRLPERKFGAGLVAARLRHVASTRWGKTLSPDEPAGRTHRYRFTFALAPWGQGISNKLLLKHLVLRALTSECQTPFFNSFLGALLRIGLC